MDRLQATLSALLDKRPIYQTALFAMSVVLVGGCGLELGQSGMACQEPPAPEVILGDRDVPDIEGMAPDVAAASLELAGIVPSWRYGYLTEPGGPGGYSECWCVPPPDGIVEMVHADSGEQLIVFVDRQGGPIIGGRPQPQLGWGCDAEA